MVDPPPGEPPPPPSARRLLRAVSWMSAGHVLGQAIWYASLLALAVLLPPSAFGAVAVAMVFVQVAWMLIDAGIGGSLVAGPALTRAQVRGAVRFNLAVGVALGAVLAVVARPVMDAFAAGADPNVLRALAAGVAVYSLAVVPLALIQKRLDFRSYSGVMVGAAAGASVVAVALGVTEGDVWALVGRQVFYQGLIAALAWIAVRQLLPRAEPGARVRWFRPPGAGSFMTLTLTNFLAFNADYLVVGGLTDTHQVGLYALAFAIAWAPVTQIAAQIGRVFLSATAATTDRAVIASRTLAGMRAVALLLFPLAAPAIVLAPEVIPRALGEEWAPMAVPFQILVVAGALHAVLEIMGNALAGAGSMPFRAKVNVPWLVAVVVVLVVLVRADGIRGAATAHLVMFVPLALVYVVWGSGRIGLDARRIGRALGDVALAIAVQAAVTVGVSQAAPEGPAGASAAAAAGLAAAALVVWRLGGLRGLDRPRPLAASGTG